MINHFLSVTLHHINYLISVFSFFFFLFLSLVYSKFFKLIVKFKLLNIATIVRLILLKMYDNLLDPFGESFITALLKITFLGLKIKN